LASLDSRGLKLIERVTKREILRTVRRDFR